MRTSIFRHSASYTNLKLSIDWQPLPDSANKKLAATRRDATGSN